MGMVDGHAAEREPSIGGDYVTLEDYYAVEYVGHDGVLRKVLISDEDQDLLAGIPLLDLGGLGLPQDIETRFREALWSVGIKEYADALKPGAGELIMMALRSALKVSTSDVVRHCQGENNLLKEAGYAK